MYSYVAAIVMLTEVPLFFIMIDMFSGCQHGNGAYAALA